MSAPVSPSPSPSPSAGKKPRITRNHPTPEPVEGLPTLFDSHQVSAYIGIEYTSFVEMRNRGRGPRFMKIGGKVRYLASDIEAWLKDHVVDPA